VFSQGPVVDAMERGAVLILDEVDLASNKIMCLQSIIDGKGVYLKKDNRFVKPAPGFTVIATANTKGKGSDDGRFIGTNVMNEAFLERFKITFEQEYPSQSVEKKILNNHLTSLLNVEKLSQSDQQNVEALTMWAGAIRKTFEEGGIDEIISTRRLVHIVETYSIFEDVMKSIELCTNRFDDDTKASFVDLFSKITGQEKETVSEETDSEEIPF
jgi:MoxR-like ATPase